jgi:predicted cupin superfamily sugar epimerase
MSQADRIIALLNLMPHPEGGHYRETFKDARHGDRAASTAIYFLLRKDEVSRWHRIDAAEVWHFYLGAPLELKIGRHTYVLGPNIDEAEAPQIVVPPGEWQSARSLGDYSLVGCTVAPGFDFAHFELAPDGFTP